MGNNCSKRNVDITEELAGAAAKKSITKEVKTGIVAQIPKEEPVKIVAKEEEKEVVIQPKVPKTFKD